LEKSGLQVGEDFFLAYTPQRVSAGNQSYKLPNIPRVVGGITPNCSELAVSFYQQFIETIIPVSSAETAEMVKLLENTFSGVNTALVNELALLSHKLGINVWEVIDAARSKPFGFMPFYPGPGRGKDLGPVDARFITSKTGVGGFRLRMIELATDINSQMSSFIIERIADALNGNGKSLKFSKILALGMSHDHDSNGHCDATAVEVIQGLRKKGAVISFADPYLRSIEIDGTAIKSVQLAPKIVESMDCVVLLNDHSAFDHAMIAAHNALVIDSRNGFKNFPRSNIRPL
jgi:UDP-N-acetyl-D-glucosamine dehydrogenase